MSRRLTDEEHEARGNPGRRPRKPAPVDLFPIMDIMPLAGMSKDALEVWRVLAPQLIDIKILRETDRFIFSVFCESFARYTKALLQLRREGDIQTVKTVSGDKMRRTNPRTRILKEERDVVLKFGEKFGLTPVDRMRVISHLAGRPLTDPGQSPPAAGEYERDLIDADADSLSNAGPIAFLG